MKFCFLKKKKIKKFKKKERKKSQNNCIDLPTHMYSLE